MWCCLTIKNIIARHMNQGNVSLGADTSKLSHRLGIDAPGCRAAFGCFCAVNIGISSSVDDCCNVRPVEGCNSCCVAEVELIMPNRPSTRVLLLHCFGQLPVGTNDEGRGVICHARFLSFYNSIGCTSRRRGCAASLSEMIAWSLPSGHAMSSAGSKRLTKVYRASGDQWASTR